MFDVWGVLPLAVLLLAFTASRVVLLLAHGQSPTEQAVVFVAACLTLVHLDVAWLASLGWLSRESLLGLLAFAAVVLGLCARGRHFTRPASLRATEWLTLAGIATVVLLAIVAARLLPVWQWDSIGYHLPFVSFVLRSGGFSDVPPDIRYISTYPHNVELSMLWLRAMLPDDRLVDLAQIPHGVFGAVVTAAIARRLGARRELALVSGAAFICAPVVFLQLPTNYVDVGTATCLLAALFFLVFSKVELRTLVLGGVMLGLYLGSKPSAPVATVALGVVVLVRAARAKQWWALGGCAAAVLVFGGEMYGLMLLRHGNPVWPIALTLGPVHLPGESTVDTLLAAQASAQRADGWYLARLTTSWLALDTHPVFDMRNGGLGLLFVLAVPAVVVALVRRRGGGLLVALAIGLLTPDGSVSRYVIAFAAVALAAAASELSRLPVKLAPALVLGVLAVAGWQVQRAVPGLTGDGPPLDDFVALDDDARRIAVGPQGSTVEYTRAWPRVGDDEVAAFDEDFEFPWLLWSPELRYQVDFVPRHVDASWLHEKNFKLLAVGPRHRALVDAEPDRWELLFECVAQPCAVYLRRD